MEEFIIDFANVQKLWEKSFSAKNQFDAFNQAKKYALNYSDVTETTVYFSFKGGDRLYCTRDIKEETQNHKISV